MPAIKVHHTPTSEGAWDGPQAKANLKNDGDEAYYRKAFAWQDPNADPATKAAYKLIHHEVNADGEIGAANLKGCSSAIGVLNGARGGADIPESDMQAVWNHLAAHMKDAGMDAPEMMSGRSELPDFVERRSFHVAELRAAQTGDTPVIEGYAAVFNQPSDDLGGFVEMIEPGFFDDVLSQDVRSLKNHNPDWILGRTVAGTLELKQDDKGLFQRTYPPVVPPNAATYATDLMVNINRGDVTQMSFTFVVKNRARGDAMDGDEFQRIEGRTIRVLKQGGCKELWDVSPVTFPAYPQTSVAASTRSRFDQFRKQQEQPPAPGDAGARDDDLQAEKRRHTLELMKMELE